MIMVENDIKNYVLLDHLISSIEVQFKNLNDGDTRNEINFLENYPFGKIDRNLLELRHIVLGELYSTLGKAFHLVCQLITTNGVHVVFEALNVSLVRLNTVISDNEKYIKRCLLSGTLKEEYNEAINSAILNIKTNLREQVEELKCHLFL